LVVQLAGEGVLLLGVVAAQQHHLPVVGAQRRGCAVAELRLRPGNLAAAGADHVQRRAPAECAHATMTRTSPPASCHSAVSHGAQVDRSAGVGAFSGGAHRTAATTRVPLSVSPSAASTLIGEFAKPARCSAA